MIAGALLDAALDVRMAEHSRSSCAIAATHMQHFLAWRAVLPGTGSMRGTRMQLRIGAQSHALGLPQMTITRQRCW